MPRRHDSELLKNLGARLKTIRLGRGWTQERLAESVGVEPLTISRFETGRRGMSVTMLAAIAEKLEIPVADLVDVQRPVPLEEMPTPEIEWSRLWMSLDERQRDLAVRIVNEIKRC